MNSEARRLGIVVWDVQAKEHVLVVPWVLAFLGDNPMSSEFASHIGMQGKCFCRRCKVKGSDTKHRAEGEEGDKEQLRDFLDVRLVLLAFSDCMMLTLFCRKRQRFAARMTCCFG